MKMNTRNLKTLRYLKLIHRNSYSIFWLSTFAQLRHKLYAQNVIPINAALKEIISFLPLIVKMRFELYDE